MIHALLKRRCLSVLFWAWLGMLPPTGTVAQPRVEEPFRFDVASQDLDAALQQAALQSRYRLLYQSELVEGLRSPPLQGEFTIEQAITVLLSQTDLVFDITARSVILIRAPSDTDRTARGAGASGNPLASAASSSVGNAAGSLDLLPEVIVTARRRDEVLQEVPISVSALTQAELDKRNIDNTENLDTQLTNVAISAGNLFGREQGAFRIRGIPGVAIYIDGVVQGGGHGQLMNIVELERVEVMRGPQGTLFGKNAIGGAIQYITRAPQDEFGMRLRATAGSDGRVDVAANVDLPVAPTLLTKLTAARLSRDGYLPSVSVDRDYGSQNDVLVRGALLWQPSEALQWRFTSDYVETRTNGNPSTVWTLNPVCPGDPPPSNYLGSTPNNLCIYQAIGLPIDQSQVFGRLRTWRTASDYLGPDLYTRASSYKTNVGWRLTPDWTLRGIAGYRTVTSTSYGDFDGIAWNLFDGQNANERDEWSAELQLLYETGELYGSTGLYFYSNDNWFRRNSWLANDLHPAVNPAQYAAALAYAPGFVPLVQQRLLKTTTDGWAAFTEWTYRATDRLSLTAGLRYNEESGTTAAYDPAVVVDNRCCVPQLGFEPAAGPLENQYGSAKFSNVSLRLSVQQQWMPRLMTYLTYSEGFGAGGFNSPNAPGVPNGGFSAYHPEILKSLELGLRSDLFNGNLRFNASLFHGRYEDIQVVEEIIPRFPTISNQGQARIKGLELEGYFRITTQFFIDYGAAWLETGYQEFGRDRSRSVDPPFAFSPRYSWTLGAQYDWTLPRKDGLSLRGDYGWQDTVVGTSDSTTAAVIPAYGLLGFRLSYRPGHGRWSAALFGTNLTDEYYRVNAFYIPTDQIDNGTLGRPREFGVTLSFALQ